MYDAIVVGGSYSGLSAALQLARARRRILVIDAGKRRNRFAGHSHGFLTQDGEPPGEIAARGRKQLLAYPTVEWIEGEVTSATQRADGTFALGTATIEATSRVVVLALGVTDTLPPIPGLEERWGKAVFVCPYCDAYELAERRQPMGVLGASSMSVHHALILSDWGRTIFFLNGQPNPSGDEEEQLAQRSVIVERTPVSQVTGEHPEIVLVDGRSVPVAGLFTTTRTSPSSDIAQQLGCAIEEGPAGPFIRTDARKSTSVPGVFACGDASRGFGSVAMAVGDGNLAGASAHQWTIF